jgi:hypothetical protein
MTGTGLLRLAHSFGIPEIIVSGRFHILIQFMHQRDAGRNIHHDNINVHTLSSYLTSARRLSPCAAINTRFPERTAA